MIHTDHLITRRKIIINTVTHTPKSFTYTFIIVVAKNCILDFSAVIDHRDANIATLSFSTLVS